MCDCCDKMPVFVYEIDDDLFVLCHECAKDLGDVFVLKVKRDIETLSSITKAIRKSRMDDLKELFTNLKETMGMKTIH